MDEDDERPAGAPEWAITFGDMMALLLTFFIMFASTSEIKRGGQFQRVADSLRERFGPEEYRDLPSHTRSRLRSGERLQPGRSSRSSATPPTAPGGARVASPDAAPVRSGELNEGVLEFEAGQAELTDDHKRTLQLVAEQFGGSDSPIEVRGRLAPVDEAATPPSRELRAYYQDNWHLAYTRCHRTIEYLKGLGIDPHRFRLGVSGEPEPVKIAARPLDWRQSERVEVLMLSERTRAAEK